MMDYLEDKKESIVCFLFLSFFSSCSAFLVYQASGDLAWKLSILWLIAI